MPELPEVETVVRTLEYRLQHVTILHCQVLWNNIIAYPSVPAFVDTIAGKTIRQYRRLGKYLMFNLGTHMWIAHMRMEGKFYIQQPMEPYDKHTHVIFSLSDGQQLRYHDTRKFGKMYLYELQEYDDRYPCFAHVGYDAFDERLCGDVLYQQLHKRSICLKAALLDQSLIAGIGNIYADEICYAMQMSPETRISHLRKKDYEKLLIETRRILRGAIQSGGTTIRSYTSSLGVDGRFQLQLHVHARKGEACPRCGTTIVKKVVVTRGTYYCPTCQKKR